jgi:hypothetical protein
MTRVLFADQAARCRQIRQAGCLPLLIEGGAGMPTRNKQQAGIANPTWTVQASVEMAAACFTETAVRVSMVGELGKENYGQGIQ